MEVIYTRINFHLLHNQSINHQVQGECECFAFSVVLCEVMREGSVTHCILIKFSRLDSSNFNHRIETIR